MLKIIGTTSVFRVICRYDTAEMVKSSNNTKSKHNYTLVLIFFNWRFAQLCMLGNQHCPVRHFFFLLASLFSSFVPPRRQFRTRGKSTLNDNISSVPYIWITLSPHQPFTLAETDGSTGSWYLHFDSCCEIERLRPLQWAFHIYFHWTSSCTRCIFAPNYKQMHTGTLWLDKQGVDIIEFSSCWRMRRKRVVGGLGSGQAVALRGG